MRKLVVCNLKSLDGYYDGPGHDVLVPEAGRELSSWSAGRPRWKRAGEPPWINPVSLRLCC